MDPIEKTDDTREDFKLCIFIWESSDLSHKESF